MSRSSPSTDPTDITQLRLPAGSLRVLQITDTHLYADPDARLLGMDTLLSLHQVLDTFGRCNWPIDLVLCTGDLVHDATTEGYRTLARLLDTLGVPVYCLPGNHDLPEMMQSNLTAERVSCPSRVDIGNWQIVLLDSVVEGAVGGHLDDEQLALLSTALTDPTHHALVALHHQPVPVGSQWIDRIGLDNGDTLLSMIADQDQVKGVLWGHVHQSFDARHGHIRLMGSPSTCVQFAAGAKNFELDSQPPGFRLLALTPDGQLHSQVFRSPQQSADLRLAAQGY